MVSRLPRTALPILLALAAPALPAQDAAAPIPLVLKDHRFQPAEIKVPAGKPVVLEVANQDAQPEEFESKPLGVEKVIPAGAKAIIRLRPLKPGRYRFVGEYHEKTAQGAVVAE
jgi:hypothetical protein